MTEQTVGGGSAAPDEWRHIRMRLARHDKMTVMGATMRQEVVDRPDLVPAQLAFVRHRQRGLAGSRRLWRTLATVCVLLALGAVAGAVFDRGSGREMYVATAVATAASLAVSAGVWGLVIPRSSRAKTGQMELLRQQIEQRREN